MNCACNHKGRFNGEILSKLQSVECDILDGAQRVLKSAGDPFSGMIRFLHERQEGISLAGYVINHVLMETFGDEERIPSLIKVLAGHIREVIRHANVINIVNEHPAVEKWGKYIIKQKESIKFEIGLERGLLVLDNIKGLVAVEHGIDLPLEKIRVKPPQLIVTVQLGLLRPQLTVDLM